MDNENNNADFPATVAENYPGLQDSMMKPAPDMTVQEFVDKAKNLLDGMLADHHEQTGIETLGWSDWMEQLDNAYLND